MVAAYCILFFIHLQVVCGFVSLPALANLRNSCVSALAGAQQPSPKDMKVSEFKAELETLQVGYHGLLEKVSCSIQKFIPVSVVEVAVLRLRWLPHRKQREFEVQLERSRAEAAEIVELRKKFFIDLQAANIPADLKKTLADMATDPALLTDMIADKSLLQDVGSDPDKFKDVLNQGTFGTFLLSSCVRLTLCSHMTLVRSKLHKRLRHSHAFKSIALLVVAAVSSPQATQMKAAAGDSSQADTSKQQQQPIKAMKVSEIKAELVSDASFVHALRQL
jgi:hypothetical protein